MAVSYSHLELELLTLVNSETRLIRGEWLWPWPSPLHLKIHGGYIPCFTALAYSLFLSGCESSDTSHALRRST
ncbi:hypothetical protein J6590_012380 [Homalodisca vitripennis]|nr:hypothetical protein J6590_012380 [Homalodisca vitripennis]